MKAGEGQPLPKISALSEMMKIQPAKNRLLEMMGSAQPPATNSALSQLARSRVAQPATKSRLLEMMGSAQPPPTQGALGQLARDLSGRRRRIEAITSVQPAPKSVLLERLKSIQTPATQGALSKLMESIQPTATQGALAEMMKSIQTPATKNALADIGRDVSGRSRLNEAIKSVQMPPVQSALKEIDLSGTTKFTEAVEGLAAASDRWGAHVIEMHESLREASEAKARREGEVVAWQGAILHHLADLVEGFRRSEEARAVERERHEQREARSERRSKRLFVIAVVSASTAVMGIGPDVARFLAGLIAAT